MAYAAHDTYLEDRVLSADGLGLVRMLYQAAIGAVQDARRHLAAKDIAARARAITKAHRILTELTSSLDHERGGEVSQGLARLYDYMSRRLIEANSHQSDPELEEVLNLLCTLAEAWEGIQATSPSESAQEPAHESRWAEPIASAPPPEPVSYSSLAWSF